MNSAPEYLVYEGGGWDENGALFRDSDGTFLRTINPIMAPFYEALFEHEEVLRLMSEGKLIHSTIMERTGPFLSIRHESVKSPTYPFEWTQAMLLSAGKLLLEVTERLLPHGICLHDASFWNVLFRGRSPVLVDFTSLVPATDLEINGFIGEFSSVILQVNTLCSDGHISVIRRLLRDYGKPIDHDLSYYLCPRAAVHGGRFHRSVNELFSGPLNLLTHRCEKLGAKLSRRMNLRRGRSAQCEIKRLREELDSTEVFYHSTRWMDYYGGGNKLPIYDGSLGSLRTAITQSDKHRNVAMFIELIKPRSYVDIGCNRGLYSHLASLTGAESIGIDVDEGSLELMCSDGDGLGSNAMPCFADVGAPAVPLGPPGKRWPPLAERCRSELVSCLALSHHLLLGKPSMSMAFLSDLLSSFTSRSLIVEFVDPDDVFLKSTYGDAPDWYSLESFKSSLGRHFSSIVERSSSFDSRRLLLCERD